MTLTADPTQDRRAKEPLLAGRRGPGAHLIVYLFVLVPPIALLAATPLLWGWGLSWLDIGLTVFFYLVSLLGVTVGYHRYFTHGAFKAKRWLRVALAVTGGTALQGPLLNWVADHRRHHAYSDREGDPHSPWLFGTSPIAIIKGFWHAHMGWLLERNKTNHRRFIPDLLRDRTIVRVSKLFWLWSTLWMILPGIVGGLATWSWQGGLTAFVWAGLVRMVVLHHVAWSVNSVCHMIGERPFKSRDKAANFWPLAILSAGESWHNLHHADPTCARHGVLPGQLDISARIIWLFERFGWAWQVRWPNPARLEKVKAQS